MRQDMSGGFNCLSRYSDTKVGGRAELQYAMTDGNAARLLRSRDLDTRTCQRSGTRRDQTTGIPIAEVP